MKLLPLSLTGGSAFREVSALLAGLTLEEAARRRSSELLTDLAAHNAYHWGQVTLLRRLAGAEFGEA